MISWTDRNSTKMFGTPKLNSLIPDIKTVPSSKYQEDRESTVFPNITPKEMPGTIDSKFLMTPKVWSISSEGRNNLWSNWINSSNLVSIGLPSGCPTLTIGLETSTICSQSGCLALLIDPISLRNTAEWSWKSSTEPEETDCPAMTTTEQCQPGTYSQP